MRKTVGLETTTDEHGNTTVRLFVMSDFSKDLDWIPEPGSMARKAMEIPDDRVVIPSIMGRVEEERKRLIAALEEESAKAARTDSRKGAKLKFHLEGNKRCTHVTSIAHRELCEERILEYDDFISRIVETQCTSCYYYAELLSTKTRQ